MFPVFAQVIFWLCFALLFYAYIGYPLLVLAFSLFVGGRFRRGSEHAPSLSVVITAYNEEKHIARKLENTLQLDYPPEKLEIIVGSDGSTDGTNRIVGEFESRGVRLLAFEKNRGKTLAQHDCVRQAKNDIIVFMDASPVCSKNALRDIAACFADERVGCVAGTLEFVQNMNNLVTQSQGVYWRYEMAVKRAEGKLGALVGADGPLYAIRRSLYSPLGSDIMEDFMQPILIRDKGAAAILEERAVTYEDATVSTENESRTRRRIILSGFVSLSKHPGVLLSWKHPVLSLQILSRKVLRWLGGIWIIGMLSASALLLANMLYLAAFVAIVSALLLAALGFIVPGVRSPVIVIPFYFVLLNLSGLRALWDFLVGRTVISWTPVR